MMIPSVVSKMVERMSKTASKTSKMLVKSIGQTPVQIVLGLVIAIYIAFLESDKESLLSVLMNNPMGRLVVMGFLAVLAVAAPPVAILFAVLVVMSYSRSDAEMIMYQQSEHQSEHQPEHSEGFWADDDKEHSKDTQSEDDENPNEKEGDMKSKHNDLLKQLSSTMKTMSPANEEGFGPMYDGTHSPDEDIKDDTEEFMNSMNGIGGIAGYSAKDPAHSSP